MSAPPVPQAPRTGFATPPLRFPTLAFAHRPDDMGDGEVFVRMDGVNHTFDDYRALRDAVLDDMVEPDEVWVRHNRRTLHFASHTAFRAAMREADRQDRARLERRKERRVARLRRRRLERALLVALMVCACWGFVVTAGATILQLWRGGA